MCWFHVIKNIKKNYKNEFEAVKPDFYYLHLSLFGEFESRKREVLQKWAADATLDEFSTYFQTQWLTGKFWKWQIFHHNFIESQSSKFLYMPLLSGLRRLCPYRGCVSGFR